MVKRKKIKKWSRLKELSIVPLLLFLIVLIIFGLRFYYNDLLITGNSVSGEVNLCINRPPLINFSKCSNFTEVNKLYVCDVDTIDDDNVTFYDNSSEFNINQTTGVISFTPNSEKLYSFIISTYDGSNCSNNRDSQIYNLRVGHKSPSNNNGGSLDKRNSKYYMNTILDSNIDDHVYKLELKSKVNVVINQENMSEVQLVIQNTGNRKLTDLNFEIYSKDNLTLHLDPNNYSVLYVNETIMLKIIIPNKEMPSDVDLSDYDLFLFVSGDHDLSESFRINLNLVNKVGSGMRIVDNINHNQEFSNNLSNIYFGEFSIIIMISLFIFLLVVKLINF